jgi:anti-sigma regulatory factor (Ser/Thr protein kinase)
MIDTVSSTYRHEAMFYANHEEFVDTAVPFVRDGVAAGERVLVVTGSERLELLRDAVGSAEHVTLADMATVGRNPGRIISVWTDFVREHAGAGRAVRGIGEPIYPERSAAELAECQLHEELLNVAFDDATPLWLMCPYDTRALSDDVIAEARRSHPYLAHGASRQESVSYRPIDQDAPFTRRLSPVPPGAEAHHFDATSLGRLRASIAGYADRAGMSEDRISDLVLAANEISTNSVRYGGGSGQLRIWLEGDRIVCEISDRGHVTGPLVGRLPPTITTAHGRGLWMANQLCDLVQLQSSAGGTTVRVQLSR